MTTDLDHATENSIVCAQCRHRSALIAALAPDISRLRCTPDDLLGLLALPDAQLLRAAKVENRQEFLHGLEMRRPTEDVPTALCRHNPNYPGTLAQLDCAPAVLYANCASVRLHGLLNQPTVAIVGSRTSSQHAARTSYALARDLASAGVTVISGMNPGLESIAHQGARDARGPTIAVMPAGPEIASPSRNKAMHRCICARGAAVSEFPSGFWAPERWGFIAGQRIIAALASLVVVVEARGDPSALFTAQIAADLGGEVAVVPGRVTEPGGLRTFGLLRDGAHPVACAQDVLDVMCEAGVRR